MNMNEEQKVENFLSGIEKQGQREDSIEIVKLMTRATGFSTKNLE